MSHCRFLRADHAYKKIRKVLMGQLRNVMPQIFTVGNTCLGWSRILMLFMDRGKEEEVKRQKRQKII
jgi:hypothetical protein